MTCGSWIVTPDKFLTAEQVARLRAALAEEAASGNRYAVRNAAIIETLLGTGLRVSELCALVVGDLFVDPGAGQVLVRRGKGRKTRLVAISDSLATFLRGYLGWKVEFGEPVDPEEPLFRSERRSHLCRSAVHRLWKGALARAGLPARWGVHGTRHSYAVEVYRKTRDLRLTQRLLGHSSPVITQLYASLIDDDVRRGVAMVWSTA